MLSEEIQGFISDAFRSREQARRLLLAAGLHGYDTAYVSNGTLYVRCEDCRDWSIVQRNRHRLNDAIVAHFGEEQATITRVVAECLVHTPKGDQWCEVDWPVMKDPMRLRRPKEMALVTSTGESLITGDLQAILRDSQEDRDLLSRMLDEAETRNVVYALTDMASDISAMITGDMAPVDIQAKVGRRIGVGNSVRRYWNPAKLLEYKRHIKGNCPMVAPGEDPWKANPLEHQWRSQGVDATGAPSGIEYLHTGEIRVVQFRGKPHRLVTVYESEM